MRTMTTCLSCLCLPFIPTIYPANGNRHSPPANSPEKSTTNTFPESGNEDCLLPSPPHAPQCAVVTYSWSLLTPKQLQSSRKRPGVSG